MKFFRNLKIGKKLIMTYLLMAILAAVVGLAGTSYIIRMERLDTDLYERFTATAHDMTAIANGFYKQEILVRDLYLNAIKANANVGNLVNNARRVAAELEEELYVSSATIQAAAKEEEVQAALNDLTKHIDRFNSEIRNQVFDLVEANKLDAAFNVLMSNKAAEIENNVAEAVDNLFQLREKYARNQSQTNSSLARRSVGTMALIIIIGFILALLLAIINTRIIAKPLQEMVAAANCFAEGDLNITITTKAKDETGILADAFRTISENMSVLLTNIRDAADQVAAGAAQIADASQSLSQGATEQAGSIEELTASITEIASQAKRNADNANHANELAETVKYSADDGNTYMQKMLNAMNDITASSKDIANIVKLIDEIAYQTNLLALNAAVEAARAGEHGKGFAVVAEEVRDLANRSAKAVRETTKLVQSSLQKIEEGAEIAGETAERLHKISADVSNVVEYINQITEASTEQAAAVEQINRAIGQVWDVVQANSAASEETAAASEELSSQAELLKEMISKFKIKEVSMSPTQNFSAFI